MAAVARKIVLHFPQRMVDRPIVSKLVREYGLDFNGSSSRKPRTVDTI